MRLKRWERVRYTPNPLVEVIAQVRFPRVLEMDDRPPSEFQKAVGAEYPLLEVQEDLLSVLVTQGPSKVVADERAKQSVYHFISADRDWRVSLTSEFVALSCNRYDKWENFLPRMVRATDAFAGLYPGVQATRVGLRYRDLIVREEIGLAGVPWRELIAPFLLGITIANEIAEDGRIREEDVFASQSSVGLKLDTCLLNLRFGLVQKDGSSDQAYLIDSDFYREGIQSIDPNAIRTLLDQLHEDAGAIFRSCILERVHTALNPSLIT